MINLFDDLPARAHEEIVTELLLRKGVRIERIVSTGQSTPADKPSARDHVLIPAHCLHRVTRTANNEPTVWLAVHLG